MIPEKIVYVLYTRICSELPEQVYKKHFDLLPETLQQKNRRYKKWQDRTAHLVGKILLVKGIEMFGYDFTELDKLSYNDYGRPHLYENIDFNISHSGQYIICAIGQDVQLGIDIEEVKPVDFSDFEDYMTAEQWRIIKDSSNPFKTFFKFWTIKESIIKADARGLSIPLNDILIENNRAFYEKTWYLQELIIDGAYSAHLATNIETYDLNIEYRQFSQPIF